MEKCYISKLSELKTEAAVYDDLLYAQRTQYGSNQTSDQKSKFSNTKKSFQQIKANKFNHVECFKCGMKGHIKKDCKGKEKKSTNKKEKSKSTHTFTDAKKKKI